MRLAYVMSTVRGSAALALFFGLNVPACSLPLLAAILGSAAVAGASQVWQGFFMLALFGVAAMTVPGDAFRRAVQRLRGK